MPLYAVSYDLNKTKNYQRLWDELDRVGAFSPMDSFYLANVTSDTARKFCDHLSKYVDEDDYLMVVPFTGKPALKKARKGTNAWLDSNV